MRCRFFVWSIIMRSYHADSYVEDGYRLKLVYIFVAQILITPFSCVFRTLRSLLFDEILWLNPQISGKNRGCDFTWNICTLRPKFHAIASWAYLIASFYTLKVLKQLIQCRKCTFSTTHQRQLLNAQYNIASGKLVYLIDWHEYT